MPASFSPSDAHHTARTNAGAKRELSVTRVGHKLAQVSEMALKLPVLTQAPPEFFQTQRDRPGTSGRAHRDLGVGGGEVDLRRESRMRKTHGCVEKSLGFAMGVPVRPGW